MKPDWLEDFQDKFGNDEDILSIKTKEVYGSLKINFTKGIPASLDLTLHKKGEI